MADTEREVKILVSAEVKDFQRQMRTAGNSTRDLQKMATRFRKDGTKGSRDLQKVATLVNKGQKAAITSAIKLEKQLQAEMAKTVKRMKDKAEASQGNVDAIQDEIKSLRELEAQLAKSKELRHSLGHRTLGERAREAFGPGGSIREGAASATRFGGAALLGAGSLISGALFARARQAYGSAEQYGITSGGLTGLGSRGDFRPGAGARFGYSMTDTAAQAAGAARATGNLGAVTQAQALSRTLGMDMGEATSVMGILRSTGQKFTGAEGRGGGGADELKKIIAAGFESGLERARMPEFIQGVGQLVQTAQGALANGVSAQGYSQLLAAFGRTGQPGLQGQMGVGVLSQLDQAIKNPGGGDAGRAVMLQALGFGTPGGNTSYYNALKQMEKGASSPENVLDLFKTTGSRFGEGEAQILALKEMTGLGISQLEGVRTALKGGDAGAALQQIKDAQEASKSVEEQGLDQMKQFGADIRRIADQEDVLINEGLKLKDPIHQIIDVEREFMEKLFNVAVQFLPPIADGVTRIAGIIEQNFGTGTPSAMDLGRMTGAMGTATSGAGALQQLSPEQLTRAAVDLARMREEGEETLQSLHSSISARSIGAGLYDIGASAAEAATGGTPFLEGVRSRASAEGEDIARLVTAQTEANRRLDENISRLIDIMEQRHLDTTSVRAITSHITSTGAHAPPVDRPTRGTR